jgi:trk system potassium uptake protein TrkA
MDVLVVHGSATAQSTLKEAGIEEAKMFVAVTGHDEVNILSCMFAKKFNVSRKIARIRNSEYMKGDCMVKIADLGVDLAVNPDKSLADTLATLIEVPGTTEIAEFEAGRIFLRGFKISANAPVIGKKIADLTSSLPGGKFLIVAILRENSLAIPTGQTQIELGDTLFVISTELSLPIIQNILTGSKEGAKKIIIYGASQIAIDFAKDLEDTIPEITIIEPSKEKAEEAAAEFSKTLILNGDAKEIDILSEAGVKDADFFLALTNDDEDNMLSSLLAKQNGTRYVVSITQNPDYIPVLESIGIDVVLNPRVITINRILKYIRHARIISVARLHESNVEIIELEVLNKSRVVGKKLKDLNIPPNVIVATILKGNQMEIPRGDSIMEENDKVIVFARSDSIPFVEKLFSKR